MGILLGERLAERRKFANLTQEKLSALIKMSVPTINRIENGRTDPKAEELLRFAAALNTSVAYLIGETDDPESKTKILDIPSSDAAETIEPVTAPQYFTIKFKRPSDIVEFSFPLGTSKKQIESAISAALPERSLRPEHLLKPASGGDTARS